MEETMFTHKGELKAQYQPRTEVLAVRVSKHMREKVQRQSMKANLSVSELVSKILTDTYLNE